MPAPVPGRNAIKNSGNPLRQADALKESIPSIRSARARRTCTMKPTAFLRSVCLWIALSVLITSPAMASDKKAKHSGKITKTRAEQIAIAKMPGGHVRSAELANAKGHQFWSVYIAKPGAKNAKEIRVDAVTGQILAVQTERPEDQAEEPAKSH